MWTDKYILVVNSGSSSLKAGIFSDLQALRGDGARKPEEECKAIASLLVSWQPDNLNHIVKVKQRSQETSHTYSGPREEATRAILKEFTIAVCGTNQPEAIAHRIVHGGTKYHDPMMITRQVKEDIAALAEFAPLHNPISLKAIEACEDVFKGTFQIAFFDTSFHRTMTATACTYGLPFELSEKYQIFRYGFHGLNVAYCLERQAAIATGKNTKLRRTIVCHLGAGCSVTACLDGRSVDTSMGFTPLEGLLMATRTGDIDASAVLYLMRNERLSIDAAEELLNKKCGLLGISGKTADMRELLSLAAADDERAKLAVSVFIHKLTKTIAAMTASLGGLDSLIFTGGIGENSSEIRAATVERLRYLGLTLSHNLNEAKTSDTGTGDRRISTPRSRAQVLVIAANEEAFMAKVLNYKYLQKQAKA